MALYDANSITGIVDGDELTQWDDLSGNDNHLIKDTITGENSVTFKNEGIAGLPSVYFNGGFMETASASSTPSSRNVTMILSFRFTELHAFNEGWNHLVGQGHDNYWRLIRHDKDSKLSLQVVNGADLKIDINADMDYVIVARVHRQMREIKLYNMKGELLSRAYTKGTASEKIPSGTQKINVARSSTHDNNQDSFSGCMRQLAIFDTYLNDDIVSSIVNAFVFQDGTLPTQTKKLLGNNLDIDLCRKKCLEEPRCKAFAFQNTMFCDHYYQCDWQATGWFVGIATIDVHYAHYGANCPGTSANSGNHLSDIKSKCDHQFSCVYNVNSNVLDDLASGCSTKNYIVKYTCRNDDNEQVVTVASDAHGKSITLTCSKKTKSTEWHTYESKRFSKGGSASPCYVYNDEAIGNNALAYNEDYTVMKNRLHQPICLQTGVIEVDYPSRPKGCYYESGLVDHTRTLEANPAWWVDCTGCVSTGTPDVDDDIIFDVAKVLDSSNVFWHPKTGESSTFEHYFTLDLGFEYNIVGVYVRVGTNRATGVKLFSYIKTSDSWVEECSSALTTDDATYSFQYRECPKMFQTRRIKVAFPATNTPWIFEIKFEINPSYHIVRWNRHETGSSHASSRPVCRDSPQSRCNYEWIPGRASSASLFQIGNLKFENHNFKNSICDDGNYHQYTVIQDVEKTVVKCDGLLIYQNFGTTSLNNKNNDIVLGAHYDSSTFHSRMQGSFRNFQVYESTDADTRGGAIYVKNGTLTLDRSKFTDNEASKAAHIFKTKDGKLNLHRTLLSPTITLDKFHAIDKISHNIYRTPDIVTCMIKIVGPCADFPALGDIGWFHDHNQGGPDPTTEAACNTRRDAWRTACGILRETEITNCFGTQYTCPLSTSSFPPSRKCGTRYVGAYMKEKNTLENARTKERLARCLTNGSPSVGQCKPGQPSVGSISSYVDNVNPTLFAGMPKTYAVGDVYITSANLDGDTLYNGLSEITGTTNLFALYDASSVTCSTTCSNADDVTQWNDLSGNDRHLIPTTATGTVTYITDGINGLPSIKFAIGQLETSANVPTPANQMLTVFVSFHFDDMTGEWNHLIGQGKDQYWTVRKYSTTNYLTTHVENSNFPNAKIESGKDYIAVARVDGKKKRMEIYNMDGELVSSSSDIRWANQYVLNSVTDADTKITAGWCKDKSTNQHFKGQMRQIAIYDTYLSDTTVSQILNLFTEKAVINKLPNYDNRWLFHTLTGNSIVDMVLAETNIVEDEAGFKVIDAGSYVLTNPYHKDEAVSTYWALKDTKSITVADNVEGFGLHNIQATIGIGVECTVDNTGSGGYTASTSALSIDIEHLFPSFQTIVIQFEAQVREITTDTINYGSIIHVGEFKLTNTIFHNSHCNDNRWHSYAIIIDSEKTVVKCDEIIIHEDDGEQSYVIAESERDRCGLYELTKEECKHAKDTMMLDGGSGTVFEQATNLNLHPSGCSYYNDKSAANGDGNRIVWNPGNNGQDNVKNRRVCKKASGIKSSDTPTTKYQTSRILLGAHGSDYAQPQVGKYCNDGWNDISTTHPNWPNIYTLQECQNLCAKNPACEGISYGKAGQDFPGKCVQCTEGITTIAAHVMWDFYEKTESNFCRMKGSFRNFEVHSAEYESISIPEVWCDEL